MDVTVVVGTFGGDEWAQLARERAIPSAETQAPVIHVHTELAEYGESLAQARNRGADQADTEWLCFLDADDELLPGFFEAMEKAEGDLLTPAVQYVRHGQPGEPMFWPVQDIRDGNYMIVSTLVRRDMFFEVGAFRGRLLYEDWDLFQRCIKAGAVVTQVPDAICRVHVNPRSMHRRGTTQQEKVEWHDRIRRDNYPELYGVPA